MIGMGADKMRELADVIDELDSVSSGTVIEALIWLDGHYAVLKRGTATMPLEVAVVTSEEASGHSVQAPLPPPPPPPIQDARIDFSDPKNEYLR